MRSGLPFGTCLDTIYLHPSGSDEFRPILGGRMHTQYPDNPTKRFFTYRNACCYARRFRERPAILQRCLALGRLPFVGLPSGWVWQALRLASHTNRQRTPGTGTVPARGFEAPTTATMA